METQLIEKEEARAKFSVSVPADDVDRAFDKTLRNLSRQVKIPGFRPGKAPRGVLVKRVGEEALAQEVREVLVESYYGQAVRKLELSPVDVRVDASEPVAGEDYTFEVEVELLPEVKLPDLDEIIIDAEAPKMTEQMVTDAIERLRFDHATMVPVERPAQAGDVVTIERLDSEAQEAGAATVPIDLELVDAELGDQVVGKVIGEEFVLELEDRSEQAPQSADASPAKRHLRVVVKDIAERDKPEPGDDFAKTLGFDTWSEVEERVRSTIQAQLEQQAFESQREEFVDKLTETSNVAVPRALIQRRKQQLLEQLAERLATRRQTIEGYIASLDEQGKRSEFESELEASAEKSVKRDLVLERLLDIRKSEVGEHELEEALAHIAAQRQTDLARLKREMGDAGLANFRFLLARDKAVREAVKEKLDRSSAIVR